MSLLNDHKTNARHLPLVQHIALAALLHLFHQLLCAVHSHFGMLLEQLVDELMIDNGIAMDETVTLVT